MINIHMHSPNTLLAVKLPGWITFYLQNYLNALMHCQHTGMVASYHHHKVALLRSGNCGYPFSTHCHVQGFGLRFVTWHGKADACFHLVLSKIKTRQTRQ